VAAYLVPRIREVPPTSSTLTGGIASQYIQYLTKPKAYGQIISVRVHCYSCMSLPQGQAALRLTLIPCCLSCLQLISHRMPSICSS
jgi:hypothetical protein